MRLRQNIRLATHIIVLLTILSGLSACNDEPLYEPDSPMNEAFNSDEFWYTRTLSRAQKLELKRKFGLGFSYDAIYGGKCDMGFIRCQVLDMDALQDDGLLKKYPKNVVVDSTAVAHSFSDYCQITDLTTQVSGGVVVFGAEYKAMSAIFEHGMDTTVCFFNKRNIERQRLMIDTLHLSDMTHQEIDRLITPSFRYGIEKIKRTDRENYLVVDSFINIFGSHVIIDVNIGAQLTLDVKTRSGIFYDYISETKITKEKLNLLFVKKEKTHTEADEKFIKQVVSNSTMELKVKGGDLSCFNSLIVNPSTTNPAANEETLTNWSRSLCEDEENPFNSNLELIDMRVAPIWMFIPDDEVAARVKSRIIADAPTMQELFGNKNWINCRIPFDIPKVTNYYSNGSKTTTVEKPWVVNTVASNRILATICKEWIPEISREESVCVIYPVYENKVNIASGLCRHKGKLYNVSWRYDRFVVQEIETKESSDYAYLTFGCLSFSPTEGQSYQDVKYLLGYEWPGSIGTNGNITNTSWYATRKFLGDFYLDTDKQFSNLPNWEYVKSGNTSKYYEKDLTTDKPFELSGIKLSGRSGTANMNKRMVRSDGYKYYINKREMWYEK